MAYTVDWANKIVSIPKADLTLVQSSPTEIRELNLNTFRLTIGDIQDSETGISYDTIVKHTAPVTVGGVELARVVEIINNYTITFEDGQYAVNLLGANSNLADRVNVNQVSVRAANSAGLVTSQAIEFGEYGGGCTIDQNNVTGNAISGTYYPIGTERVPSDNIADTELIATFRGFKKIFVKSNLDVNAGDDISGYILYGENAVLSTISIDAAASALNTEIQNATITGTLDGNTIVRDSIVTSLNYINGVIFNSLIADSTISLGGTNTAYFLNCYSGVPGLGTPIIDCNGIANLDTTALVMRNYSGGIKLIDFNGGASASLDFNSGQLILDVSCTNGTIVVRGNAKVFDSLGNHLNTGTYNGNLNLYNECVYGEHLHDLWQLQGLDTDNPMTVTPSLRTTGDITQDITGDGETTTTVTRRP